MNFKIWMKKSFLYGIPAFCLIVLLSFALVSCATSGKISAGKVLSEDPAVISGTLGNGMNYKILKNEEPENRIFLRLAVKAGSLFEEDDQKGVAHFVEHMAFNGTEHFKENELVDYFESIGMSFGPEVNAYTSFDETVYMLEIPADDPTALEKALLVLSDWAGTITFDQTELDKERGVIIEEWRLGRGASGRITDAHVPLLYGGSRYAERLPIGDPEIIRTIPRERVVDFYRKWYRPERMTAIIVGDADPSEIKKAVENILGQVPASQEKQEYPSYDIPVRTDKAVQVLKDPELSYTVFQIVSQVEPSVTRTVGDFREELVRRMIFSIFSDRLDETLISADSVLLDAGCGLSKQRDKASFVFVSGVPDEGKFRESLSFVMEKIAQLQLWGVSDSEAERIRSDFINMAEQTWLNRDKVSSDSKASSLLKSALYNEPALSTEDLYKLYKNLVPGITTGDLNDAVKKYFPGMGSLLLVSGPDSGAYAADLPSEKELMELWTEWEVPENLEPYSEDDLERPLFDREITGTGKVVSKEKMPSVDSKDMEIWKLSNGSSVIVNPTSFKPNEIIFSAFSAGGLSLVSDKDYLSGSVADSYAGNSGLNGFSVSQLEKKLSGKTVSLSTSIGSNGEAMTGYSSNTDLETLLQLVNLSFTAPYFTDDAWSTLITSASVEASTRLASPEEKFYDAIIGLRYGDNIRFKNLTPEMVEKMDQQTAERIYRERFSNAGDFVFIFTGSFDKKELENFVSMYLATLPSSPEREKTDASWFPAFPDKINAAEVHAGIEDKATVFVSYGGTVDVREEDFELFDSLTLLLDIKMRELVREKLGGTYGVYAYGGISSVPSPRDGSSAPGVYSRQYSLSIQFGCAPESCGELFDAVVGELKDLAENPVNESYINKLKETYRRNRESGLKNNSYLHARILSRVRSGLPPVSGLDTESVIGEITAGKMQEMVGKYISPDRYIKAVLLPENFGG